MIGTKHVDLYTRCFIIFESDRLVLEDKLQNMELTTFFFGGGVWSGQFHNIFLGGGGGQANFTTVFRTVHCCYAIGCVAAMLKIGCLNR